MGILKALLAIITGNIAVTYVHTRVRKIVFPIAIFLNALNQGWGILGAEYRNVMMAEAANQYQSGTRKKKKMHEPVKPIKNKMRWKILCFLSHSIRGDSINDWEVRYQ
jgi:hypothetical protein